MTLVTKLAACRPVSIHFPTLAILALAACSAGEVLSPPKTPSGYITKIVLTPDKQTTTVNKVVHLQAFAKSSTGDSVPVTVQWSASGGTVDSTGAFSAKQPGTYQIVGTLPSGSVPPDTAIISVLAAMAGVVLKPDSASLQPGGTINFTVSGRLTDGSLTAIDGALFSATGGSITPAGSYTASNQSGTFQVIARTSDGLFADTSIVKVSAAALPPVLQAIEISPASVSLQTRASQQFSVIGRMSNGTTTAVSGTSFTATGGSIASTGAYTAGSIAGSYRVVVKQSSTGFADTATVKVSLPPITSIVLTPASVSLAAGSSQQFSVSGKRSDGSTAAATAAFSATGGTITSGGAFTAGQTAGTFRIIAVQSGGALADTSSVTISVPTSSPPPLALQSLTLTPATASLNSGATQQFSASGKMSDGSTVSITDATWTATGGTVSTSGLYTAGQTGGSYRVIAAKSGKADTSAVSVAAAPPTLQTITLTPATANIRIGATQQFSMSGKMSDGSTASITNATWTATGGAVSTSGLYTAGQTAGSYRVIATSSGKADTAAVTVTAPPTLQSIAITPSSATVNTGATQQFSVSGKMSDGSSASITNAVWTATGGTVSTSGLYTAGGTAGSFSVRVTASAGALSASAGITVVTPAPPPPPPPSGGGNEPAGFSRIAEISFAAMPTGSLWSCSGPGVLAGCWFSTAAHASTQQDASAPKSPPGVYQYEWPAGLAVGSSDGILGIWSSGSRDQYSQVYESGWIKIPSPDLELPQSVGGMKLLGFWSVGQAALTGQVGNQIVGWINGSGIQSSFTLDIRQQNQVARAMSQNVSGASLIQAGRWIRYEILMTINDIGVANGTLKVWINGTQTHHYTNVVWRTSSAPSLFFGRLWDPTWGGNGSVPDKTRNDFMWIDHVYISAVR